MNERWDHWNYRIILHDTAPAAIFITGADAGTALKSMLESPVPRARAPWYAIHEVHYAKDETITAWTADPVYLAGDTKGDLKADLKLIRRAFNLPVLFESELIREMEARR